MKKKYIGKKVLVWGLGLHGGGVGSAEFFARQGADVTVTDLKKKSVLKESLQKLKQFKNIRYVLGKHVEADFKNQDIIVVGPGIPASSPFLKIAKKSGAKLVTDIQIFFEECEAPIYAVTGTKGKTTTTMLLYAMIQKKWKAHLGGNIRVSVLGILPKIKKDHRVVLELSSFQVETLAAMKKSPHGAIVTNLSPDHLDRYVSQKAYYRSKYDIFLHQKANDIAVLNYDTKELHEAAKTLASKVYWFSSKKKVPQGLYINNSHVVFRKEGKEKIFFPVTSISLSGEHNVENVLAATLLAYFAGVPVRTIEKVLKNFSAVPGRLEKVRTFKRRTFVNDTTATVPISTIVALRSFQKPVVLICGGSEKNLSFKELVREVGKQVRFVVLMNDKASFRILREVKRQKIGVPYVFADSMRQAVKKAYEESKESEIILLSPACASFGLFKNEFDRGDQFVTAVKRLQ